MKPEQGIAQRFSSPLWPLIAIVLIVLLAYALRLNDLGSSSLRGDEAFAIRYWAQSPTITFQTLAGTEPHPLGTFTLFWLWKSLIGDSEFAMRILSLLGNLIGVPAMAVLGRRLFKSWPVGLVAAFLWAINPNLIWHSQDARNYALWAGISALNLWLLLRAVQRSRRIDWALYILGTTLGLYIFFLEAFIVAVHGLVVVIYQHRQLRRWLGAMLIVGVFLIPWLAQGWALAHSGYSGTATRSDLSALWFVFFPTYWLGEAGNIGSATIQVALAVIFIGALAFTFMRQRKATAFSVTLLVAPTLLLIIAAVKLDVFRPRYLIAVTPALLLPVAYMTVALWASARSRERLVAALGLGLLVGISASTLFGYYTFYQKAPNWRALGELLGLNTTAQDVILIDSGNASGITDPAFEYYYRGPAKVQVLPYEDVEVHGATAQALADNRTAFLVPLGVESEYIKYALGMDGSLIGEEAADQFHVQLYTKHVLSPNEVVPLNLKFGDAQLHGYTLLGTIKTGSTLFVLLNWQTPPSQALKVFVHLLGAPKADGSPLWTQDDHPSWLDGPDAYRIDLASTPPGTYTLEIGVYNPANGQRVIITDSDSGAAIGESYILQSLTVTP